MKAFLATVCAAVTIAWAGSASADVVLYEKSGNSNFATSGLISLPGEGHYRAEMTSSSVAYLEAMARYLVHWDTFVAPPPRPHSQFLEGNDYNGSSGDAGYMQTLVYDFVFKDSYRYFNASSIYEDRGIPAGTLLYEWTRSENIELSFRFDTEDQGNVMMDYTFKLTQISAVPEPATWAVMIVGFGLAGSALRRQRLLTA